MALPHSGGVEGVDCVQREREGAEQRVCPSGVQQEVLHKVRHRETAQGESQGLMEGGSKAELNDWLKPS